MNVSSSAFCPQIAVNQYAPNGPETVQIQHTLNHRLCLICSANFPCQYSVLLGTVNSGHAASKTLRPEIHYGLLLVNRLLPEMTPVNLK